MSGRGTSGGVLFQAEVGAYIAGLLLAERPLSRLSAELPGTPRKLFFETPAAVDDLLINTDCGEIYVQAKRTISLSPKAAGELASVANQFVRQFRTGVTESVELGDNLGALVEIFKQNDSAGDQGFRHLVGSLLIKDSLKQPIKPEPWAHLLG